MNAITASIIIVGKSGHVRDALAGLLGALPCPRVIFCAETAPQAIAAAVRCRPTLVLILANLGDSEVTALVAQMKALYPGLPCLLVSERSEEQREALHTGADRVLPTGASADRLMAAVRQAITQ